MLVIIKLFSKQSDIKYRKIFLDLLLMFLKLQDLLFCQYLLVDEEIYAFSFYMIQTFLSCTTSKSSTSAQGFSQYPLHLHFISAFSITRKYLNNLGTE